MRFVKFGLAGLLIIYAFMIIAPVAALEVTIRDDWMVIEHKGKPAGIRRLQLRRTDTGYKYIIDSAVLLTRLDGELVQSTGHWELTVDKQYHAEAFQLINETGGSITHLNGEITDHQVKLQRISVDSRESFSYCQIEGPLYFFYSYTDYLSRTGQLQADQTYQALIFDPDTLKPLNLSFTAAKTGDYNYKGKSIQLFSLNPPGDQNPAVIMNSKGDYYRWTDSVSNLIYTKIERNALKGINGLPAFHFLIAGNTEIADPIHCVFSRIQVSWSDVARNEFRWEDNRQKLTGSPMTPAKNEALVTIKTEERDFTGKITLPVADKKLAPYLVNDPTVTASPASVKKLAGEVLAGETDAWRVTQQLISWVYDTIRSGVSLERLTIEAILSQKNGQPLNYAILFAALARAAGLPARIAWGERYLNGVWVEHAWNEVWLGEWVAVDAFDNQAAPDSLLLKLYDSASSPEIRKFSAKMLGNLDINIMENRTAELDESGISAVPTGIYGQTYINRDFRCFIKAPDAWRLIETSEADLPVLVMQPLSNNDITGILIMVPVPAGTTAEQALGDRFPELKDALAHYDQVQNSPVDTGEGLTLIEDDYLDNNDRRFRRQNWLEINGDIGYLLVFLAPDEAWAGYESDFVKIKDSFGVIKK